MSGTSYHAKMHGTPFDIKQLQVMFEKMSERRLARLALVLKDMDPLEDRIGYLNCQMARLEIRRRRREAGQL